MTYVGRYINMDASVERRRKLEAQFARLGCADRYRRFAAVDGRALDRSRTRLTAGELGCFMSHYQCLQDSLAVAAPLHIIEDDVVFGPRTLPVLDQTLADGFAQFEMIFTDIFIPGQMNTLFALMGGYRASGVLDRGADGHGGQLRTVSFLDLQPLAFAATASYLVRPDAKAKLLDLMGAEIARGPTTQIDMFLKQVVAEGRIKAACAMPFLTSVDVASVAGSTIEGRGQHDGSTLAFFLMRNYFFLDKDEAQLAALAEALDADLPDPHYMDTLLAAFRFIFSGGFRVF